MRPVYEPTDYADSLSKVIECRLRGELKGEECRAEVEHLDWPKLSVVWKKWFLEGIDLKEGGK